jgi:predicted  nucleic acid-binding Zn-ribbon protein
MCFVASCQRLSDRLVSFVERMLDPSTGSELALRNSKGQALHKQLPRAKTPHEQESLQRTIEATDKQIDTLVYELYNLTEKEIQIIQGGNG